MRMIEADSAAEYLCDSGQLAAGERPVIAELSGGVSNRVLRVSFADPRQDFVLKQARPQLRTPQPWFCGVERIWREADVLRTCQRLLTEAPQVAAPGQEVPALAIATPLVLWEDRENYCYAMTAAPADHSTWKAELLSGQTRTEAARCCGRMLGILHAQTWQDAELARQFGDRQIFIELRIDPYYRTVARNCPHAAARLNALTDSVWEHPLSLVHADFSPKNLLAFDGGLMLIDFETGHFGDPAFDLGFFLSHLVLKAIRQAPGHEPYLRLTEAFWQSYAARVQQVAGAQYAALEARAVQNFAGCAWARVDGASQVEYLTEEPRRNLVRKLCDDLLSLQPPTWQETLAATRRSLEELHA